MSWSWLAQHLSLGQPSTVANSVNVPIQKLHDHSMIETVFEVDINNF